MLRRAQTLAALIGLAAPILLVSGVAWGAAIEEAGLEVADVAVSRVRLEAGCGPTPVPGAPPPQCPTVAYVEFVFRGKHCDVGDFELRVRQRRHSQAVAILRRTDSDCLISNYSWSVGEFTRLELTTGGIQEDKPVRWKNSVPTVVEYRP